MDTGLIVVVLTLLAYLLALAAASAWASREFDRAPMLVLGAGVLLPAAGAAIAVVGSSGIDSRISLAFLVGGPILAALVVVMSLSLRAYSRRGRAGRALAGFLIVAIGFGGLAAAVLDVTLPALGPAVWLLPLLILTVLLQSSTAEGRGGRVGRGAWADWQGMGSGSISGLTNMSIAFSGWDEERAAGLLGVAGGLGLCGSVVGILVGLDRSIWWLAPVWFAFGFLGLALAVSITEKRPWVMRWYDR